MKLLTRYSICFVWMMMIMAHARAQQSIIVTAEKKDIILGEPLKLNVRIAGNQAYEAIIPDSLGHFEILRIDPVENRTVNGNTVTDQQLLVTCFDSGRFRIPPLAIAGHEAIVSAGFDVMVTPLPADSTKTYGDIKQIINLNIPEQLPYQAALAALVLLSGWLIWRLNQKQQAITPAATGTVPVITSSRSLWDQLLELKQQWQSQQTSSMDLGNGLMDISKKYFAGKGIYAKSKTGEELIVASKTRLDADTWMGIAQAIRLCNAMRFGKFEASIDEGLQGINAIEKTIQPMGNSAITHTAYFNNEETNDQ